MEKNLTPNHMMWKMRIKNRKQQDQDLLGGREGNGRKKNNIYIYTYTTVSKN